MAKMHFRYGVMGSSKTAEALMLAYNFKERGRLPLLTKPEEDTRTPTIWSRIGLEAECVPLSEVCATPLEDLGRYDCIVVDEIQFASPEQVEQLAVIADTVNIPVFAYGLKTGYTGELFPGSKRMVELADDLEAIRTSCWCGKEACMTALIINGQVYKDPGKQQETALDGEFISLCRKHWREGRLK